MEEPKSCQSRKLNGSNYRSWSQVVKSHLDSQDLWEVVKGDDKKPERPSTPTTVPQLSIERTSGRGTHSSDGGL